MPNFLDLIKGEGVAVQIIKSLVDQPISASAILSKLTEQGIGIRRQTGLQVVNYLRSTVAPARDYIDFLTLNSLPNVSRIPQSVTKLLRNFSYSVDINGFDANTGEIVTRTISVSTNDLLSKQQAVDIAVGIAESNAGTYGVSGGSGRVTDVFQNSAGLIIP